MCLILVCLCQMMSSTNHHPFILPPTPPFEPITWQKNSMTTVRTLRPLRLLFFRQKAMSLWKARNSKSRWRTEARMVMAVVGCVLCGVVDGGRVVSGGSKGVRSSAERIDRSPLVEKANRRRHDKYAHIHPPTDPPTHSPRR